MAVVRLSDIVEPAVFTAYILQETMTRTAFYESGVIVPNGVISTQLKAGAHSFTVPFWNDLADDEANIANDDPASISTPYKLSTGQQLVRKAFLHQSWSAMNLASEIAGDNAISRVQARVRNYWQRQVQSRLIASLNGILADNVANDSSDMVNDISGDAGAAAVFASTAVIDTAATMGDAMNGLVGIAMHSDIYTVALKADNIDFIPDSQGKPIATYRGLAVIVDDGLPVSSGDYTSMLFGRGAVGYALAGPSVADGTEVESLPSAGNGGGQQVLHSRVNLGLHPAGFGWVEGSVASESPTLTELALAANWDRVVERKACPVAFLIARAVQV